MSWFILLIAIYHIVPRQIKDVTFLHQIDHTELFLETNFHSAEERRGKEVCPFCF